MSAKLPPPGRPPKDEHRADLAIINFKVDAETLAILERLESRFPAVRGRRSMLLRKLIHDAGSKQR